MPHVRQENRGLDHIVQRSARVGEDRFDGLDGRFRLGRDVRIFLIFLGALFNQATLTLVVIAAVMNVETIRRLIICRDHE